MTEIERGPLEKDLHERLRNYGLGLPEMLTADVEGHELSTDDLAKIAVRFQMGLMEAVLRLAKEIDQLKAAAS